MLLVLTVVLLAQSEYPKVVRKDGQVCVQNLNAKGAIEESCRAEGSDVRTPLPTADKVFRPLDNAVRTQNRAAAVGAPTPSALYWASAKQNWALAFKFAAVGAMISTLVSSITAMVVSGTNVPHAADTYLVGAAVSGTGALLFTVVAVLLDRWGFHEIEPEPEPEADVSG